MRFQTQINVDATAEHVWKIMIDVVRWPEFIPTTTRVERLDDGSLAVGSTTRIKQPGLLPMVWHVTEYVPGRSFTWLARSGGVTTEAGHMVSSDGEFAQVTIWINQYGRLAPLVALLRGARTRRYVRVEIESLKRRCESPR